MLNDVFNRLVCRTQRLLSFAPKLHAVLHYFIDPRLLHCIDCSDENNKNHFLVTFIYMALICLLHINYFPTAIKTTNMIILRKIVAAASSILLVLLSTPAVVEGTCECEKVCPNYVRKKADCNKQSHVDICWKNRGQCFPGVSKKVML